MTTDPTLACVLDAARLSDLVGCPVHATHLRPKPGVSAVAALADPAGRPVGWVQALTGDARVKADKTRDRAQETGWHHRVGSAEIGDTLLLWGQVQADPRLARSIARLGLQGEPAILRYNPLRRLVVRVGDRVHRITADKHARRLGTVTRALAGAGLPVGTPLGGRDLHDVHGLRDRILHDQRVTTWAWVDGAEPEDGDTPALRRLGTLLAHLHALPATPALARHLPHRDWVAHLAAARSSVDQLATLALATTGATRASAIAIATAQALLERLGGLTVADAPLVVSHGDFSLDQCVVTRDGAVHLLDLDRAALAPAALDLATLRAACLVEGREGCDEVVGAYAAAHPGDGPEPADAAAPWLAAALLARVSQPWRAQHPDWAERTVAIVGHAAALLDAAHPAAARPADSAPAAAAANRAAATACLGEHAQGAPVEHAPATGEQVPAEVVDEGSIVTVSRAWPGKVRGGVHLVSIEGRDQQGRLRAGTWDGERARLLPPGRDPALPALAEEAAAGELIVHRAGRRAVVRRPDGYVKILRPGKAPGVAVAGETGHAFATSAGLAAPQVLAATADTLHLTTLAGRPLHDLAGAAGWSHAWQQWAQAWIRLQALPTDGRGLGLHTDLDEAHVLRTWLTRAQGLLDGTPWPERIDEIAYRLERRAANGRRPLVPAHRDLHDKQVLWDGAQVGVLDLDTACLADRALDPANLAAHASLRVAQGLWAPDAAQLVRAAARDVAAAAGVDDADFMLAEAATVVRLVCVYAYRPQWREVVRVWAEEALTVAV